MRQYKGNPTGERIQDFWKHCRLCGQEEKWLLAFRSKEGPFVNFKLYNINRSVCRKGNYWLTFGLKTKTFVRKNNADRELLEAHRPDLYNEVLNFLEDYYG